MSESWPTAVKILVAVKKKFKADGKLQGTLDCPECNEAVNYSLAPSNHHVRAHCAHCDISLME